MVVCIGCRAVMETCPRCTGGGIVCCALCSDARVVPTALASIYRRMKNLGPGNIVDMRDRYWRKHAEKAAAQAKR